MDQNFPFFRIFLKNVIDQQTARKINFLKTTFHVFRFPVPMFVKNQIHFHLHCQTK
jgi:hypothetical protein